MKALSAVTTVILLIVRGVHAYTPPPGPACAYGRCVETRDEEYTHPSINFTYIHTDTLCAGMLVDCVFATNHTNLCSRTSLGICRGRGVEQESLVPKTSVNFERVGFMTVRSDHVAEILPTMDKPANCSFESMVGVRIPTDLDCFRSIDVSPYMAPFAVGDRPRQDRIGSGFQNSYALAAVLPEMESAILNTNYEGGVVHKMESSIIEDRAAFVGMNFLGIRSSVNVGEPLKEMYSPIVYATVEDVACPDGNDTTPSECRFTHEVMSNNMERLGREAPRLGWICVSDEVSKDDECIGNPRVMEKDEFMYTFFNLGSPIMGNLPYLEQLYETDLAGVRLKFWSPDALQLDDTRVNGVRIDEYGEREQVQNFSVPLSEGWLHVTMPPKYHYGERDVEGDKFVPKGTGDVIVFCSFIVDEGADEGSKDYPVMYFDFFFQSKHASQPLEYVSYSVNVKATLDDPYMDEEPSASTTDGDTATMNEEPPTNTGVSSTTNNEEPPANTGVSSTTNNEEPPANTGVPSTTNNEEPPTNTGVAPTSTTEAPKCNAGGTVSGTMKISVGAVIAFHLSLAYSSFN